MMTDTKRVIDNQDRDEWLQARPGERFLIRVPAAATNGSYSIVDIISSPGDSTPVHVHEKEDEHMLVVEGTARCLLGDRTFDAQAGTVVSLPRGIAHAWGNATDQPLRLVFTVTPGGCEEALRLIAAGGDQVDVLAIAARFSTRVIAPPLLSV
jgi:quercetin dioxygenase-like cupin family protein